MSTVDLKKVSRVLQTARQRSDAALESAREAAITAHAAGMPETEIARVLSVNRMTVRRWLGKL